MKARNRNRGYKIEKSIYPVPQQYGGSGTIRWTQGYPNNDPSQDPIILTRPSLVITNLGINIKEGDLPDPDVMSSETWGRKLSFSDFGAVAEQFEDLFRKQLDPSIWEEVYGSTSYKIPFVEHDTYEYMGDTITPNFKQRQGKEFIVNPCFSSKIRFALKPSGAHKWELVLNKVLSTNTISFNFQLVPTGYAIGLPAPAYSDILAKCGQANADDAASTFANAFAKVQAGEAELLTIAAESGKTINYLNNRIRSLAGMLIHFKRSALKLDIDAIADLWLEVRYAIRPLLYDIQNVSSALSKGSLDTVRTFRASDKDQNSSSHTYSSYYSGTTFNVEYTVTNIDTYTAGVYTRLKYDLPEVHTFGLLNFTQTAWELVPFSFIVDWFINVSAFLASINPNPIYEVETGFSTNKRLSYVVGTITATRSGKDPEQKNFSFVRQTYSRKETASPSLFNIDVELNVPKLVDLLALARRFL